MARKCRSFFVHFPRAHPGQAHTILAAEVAIVSNGNQSSIYTSKPGDPNYMIGKALKSTGSVALALGVPCLLTGSILMAVGYEADLDMITKNQVVTASCILFPIGASLTIVGIPLYAHGKKIMTMNFNYTGNGVGVAMEF